MRVLGLDYGRKRIGVALSDPMGMTAQPNDFIPVDNQLIVNLRNLVAEQEVTAIVLGYPIKMNGSAGDMADEVTQFGKKLEAELALPIHYWNERLSTAEAEKFLISANVRRDKRKQVRDSMAATLILQGFLDSNLSPWKNEK